MMEVSVIEHTPGMASLRQVTRFWFLTGGSTLGTSEWTGWI